jgi:hypothetical protein
MDIAGAKRVSNTTGCNGLVIAGSLGFAGDAAGMTGEAGIMGAGITILNMAKHGKTWQNMAKRSELPLVQSPN